MKKNAIVVCCTGSHIPYATVTLLSCWNHGAKNFADLHLVVLDVSDEEVEKFEDFIATRSVSINLHRVDLPRSALGLELNHLGLGAVLRLFLDEWISHDYDRVLYLDTDILVVGPIGRIFELDLGGKPIGALEDFPSLRDEKGQRRGGRRFDALGMNPNSRYFNAGVLLMDWKAVISGRRLPNSVATGLLFRSAGVEHKLADQDVLNVEFENDWALLSAKYNSMWFFAPHLPQPAIFLHFAGPFKPWGDMLSPVTLKFSSNYRIYLQDSPWKLPKRPKWQRNTGWSFWNHLNNRFDFPLRRAIRSQVPQD